MRGVNEGSAKLGYGQIRPNWSSAGTDERFGKSRANAGSAAQRKKNPTIERVAPK